MIQTLKMAWISRKKVQREEKRIKDEKKWNKIKTRQIKINEIETIWNEEGKKVIEEEYKKELWVGDEIKWRYEKK